MPPVPGHTKTSLERTGKEYKEVHEWLDLDPDKKTERHDVTRIYENGRLIEEQYGKEAREEYVRHLHDDMKAKFTHLQHDWYRVTSRDRGRNQALCLDDGRRHPNLLIKEVDDHEVDNTTERQGGQGGMPLAHHQVRG